MTIIEKYNKLKSDYDALVSKSNGIVSNTIGNDEVISLRKELESKEKLKDFDFQVSQKALQITGNIGADPIPVRIGSNSGNNGSDNILAKYETITDLTERRMFWEKNKVQLEKIIGFAK